MKLLIRAAMGNTRLICCLAIMLAACASPGDVEAGIEHFATMYGILPADIALAGARSDGAPDAAAAYHNPAALADLPLTAVSVGYLWGQPEFRGGVAGEESRYATANRLVSLAIALPLGRVFEPDYPLGMGVSLAVDDNFGRIVYFDDREHPEGDFIRYGPRSFNLVHSLGGQALAGLNLGVGYLLTYSAEVDIVQDIQIAGATENEQIRLIGRPAFAPLAGAQWQSDWVGLGVVYRSKLLARVEPVTGDTTPKAGETTIDVYPTAIKFNDAFAPHQFVLGVGVLPRAPVSATVQAEYALWGQLDDEPPAAGKSSRELDLRTHDTVVGRLGVTGRPDQHWEIRGGVAYEPSPFSHLGSGRNIVLDNDRWRLAAGGGYTFQPAPFRAPLSIDAAAFALPLVPREQRLSDGRLVRSRGALYGGAAALTFRY